MLYWWAVSDHWWHPRRMIHPTWRPKACTPVITHIYNIYIYIRHVCVDIYTCMYVCIYVYIYMRVAWILHIYIYTVSEVYADECLYVNGSASHSHSYPLPRLQKPRTTGATASSEQQLPFKPWMATMSTHCDPPTLINKNWWRWKRQQQLKLLGAFDQPGAPTRKRE